MGYYVRAFCKKNRIPSISDIFDYLISSGYSIDLTEDYKDLDITTDNWDKFEFIYKKGKNPILVEITKAGDPLLKDEIDEFIDEIGKPGLSFYKNKVIMHLKKTKYIIANQLSTSDIDDDGYNANGEFLKYFIENFDGIIQADGEGFYKGSEVIVPLK